MWSPLIAIGTGIADRPHDIVECGNGNRGRSSRKWAMACGFASPVPSLRISAVPNMAVFFALSDCVLFKEQP